MISEHFYVWKDIWAPVHLDLDLVVSYPKIARPFCWYLIIQGIVMVLLEEQHSTLIFFFTVVKCKSTFIFLQGRKKKKANLRSRVMSI